MSAADTQRMALVWESQELLALNKSIMTFIKDQAYFSYILLHAAYIRTGVKFLACCSSKHAVSWDTQQLQLF